MKENFHKDGYAKRIFFVRPNKAIPTVINGIAYYLSGMVMTKKAWKKSEHNPYKRRQLIENRSSR